MGDGMIGVLNRELFALWGTSVTVAEAIGFLTGALCVWGVTRQAVWNWPVGLVNNLVFGYLFVVAGLYAETVLQVVFGVMGLYGWWAWSTGRRSGELRVRQVGAVEARWLIAAGVVGTVAVALALTHGTDSTVPWPDAFVLAASLVATYGQARKILQSWYVWILVDLVSIPLYVSRELLLTALLYTGFLALCVRGLLLWRADLHRQTAGAPAADPVVGRR